MACLLVLIFSCGSSSSNNPLPGISGFIKSNPQFGNKIISTIDLPDWAQGKRQRVITDKGEYLFYMKETTVDGVWAENQDGSRVKLYKQQ